MLWYRNQIPSLGAGHRRWGRVIVFRLVSPQSVDGSTMRTVITWCLIEHSRRSQLDRHVVAFPDQPALKRKYEIGLLVIGFGSERPLRGALVHGKGQAISVSGKVAVSSPFPSLNSIRRVCRVSR